MAETTYTLIDNATGKNLVKNANLSDLFRVLNLIKDANKAKDALKEATKDDAVSGN